MRRFEHDAKADGITLSDAEPCAHGHGYDLTWLKELHENATKPYIDYVIHGYVAYLDKYKWLFVRKSLEKDEEEIRFETFENSHPTDVEAAKFAMWARYVLGEASINDNEGDLNETREAN